MFKRNKKTDSRIRFQNSRFRHKLQRARGYKRITRTLPAGKGEIFLSKIGLGSWLSRFGTLAVFLFLIYLVFIPNIFFIKHINIIPAQTDDKQSIQTLANSYLDKRLPWPQKNLILLSTNGLKDFLLKNDQKILTVNKIDKTFPSTLNIDVTPRVDQFAILTGTSTAFSISIDGLVTSQIFLSASGTLPSGLILIKLDNTDGLQIGHNAFSGAQTDYLNGIFNQIPGIIKSPVANFGISSLAAPDITAYAQNGFKLLLPFNSGAEQVLSHLKLLFSQFPAADIPKLFYVDMRFGDKGYVCYKGTPCVNQIILPNNAASSTPDTIKIQ